MLSVNEKAVRLTEKLVADPEAYKAAVHRIRGAFVIDCGVEAPGGWEAAKLVTEILFGGLNEVHYGVFPERIGGMYFNCVQVFSDRPILQQAACNISGWELRPGKYAPVLAGPGRTLARKPGDWLEKYSDYADRYTKAVLTVEKGTVMSEDEVQDLIDAVGIDPQNLYIILAASGSPVCSVEVAARILEQTLHRLLEEGFNMDAIVDAHGFCVIPPVAKDDLIAMGRVNDVLMYGGQSTYTVDCEDSEIEAVIGKITADKSPVYGTMFKDIYQQYGCDFYRVPSETYSPAKVVLVNQRTGSVYTAGGFNLDVLAKSFNCKG